jgi:hypothetical protein
MNPDETPSSILSAHLIICSELHSLLLEESQMLRSTGSPPDEGFLERKRVFLPRLDDSLEKLRQLNETKPQFSREEIEMVEEGRKKLLQIMMLDRENERLLLKASMPPQVKAAYAPVVPGKVARAYGQFGKKKNLGGDMPSF